MFFSQGCKRPEQKQEVEEPSLEAMQASLGGPPPPSDRLPAKSKEPGEQVDPGAQSFPFERKLIDSKGREMAAKISGKTDGEITMIRLSDKKRFVLPLEKLSDDGREFFRRIPDRENNQKNPDDPSDPSE